MSVVSKSDRDLYYIRSSFDRYAPRCLVVKTKTGALAPFVLNKAQRFLLERAQAQLDETGKVRIIGLKGRQQGFSTFVSGRLYYKLSGEYGKRAFILTHLAEATGNLFSMIRRYHQHCPDVLRPSTRNDSGTRLVFDKLESEFSIATAESTGTGRSATAQFFHGSEVAYWKNAEMHMAGIGQIVPDAPGTEIYLESTANGIGNMFHSMWQDAVAGVSEYWPVFVPWFWQDEYRKELPYGYAFSAEDAEYNKAFGLDEQQGYWRVQKIITDFRGKRSLFDAEYPGTPALAFQRVDGDPLLPPELIMAAIGVEGLDVGGAPKIVGLDVAEYGTDDSAFAYRVGRKVEFVQRKHGLGPMEVVGWAAKKCDELQPDAINVDCTGIGSGVSDRLMELGYPVNRVHFGERAIDSELYQIRRDEMWGEMRKWFEDKPCSIPNDERLITDLTGPQYRYDSSRRLKLESKEDMRKRGIRSPDCFVAGTLITTINGDIPIEQIKHGDLVMTPFGWKSVVDIFASTTNMLTTLTFNNGSELSGKGSHKIFTFDCGWVRMDAVSLTNEIESNSLTSIIKWKILSALFTRVKSSGFKKQVDIISREGTVKIRRRDFYTVGSGLIIMEKYLKDFMSIIRTMTGPITELKILKYLTQVITSHFIGMKTCVSHTPSRGTICISKWQDMLPLYGMAHLKGDHGIVSMVKKHGNQEKSILQNAPYAMQNTKHTFLIDQGFVQDHANKKKVFKELKHLKDSALDVVKRFFTIDIGRKNVAPVRVQTYYVQNVPVYNLAVAEENVYFANNILVSNCGDALALTFAVPISHQLGSHRINRNRSYNWRA